MARILPLADQAVILRHRAKQGRIDRLSPARKGDWHVFRSLRLSASCVFALCAGTGGAYANVVFMDNTFNLAQYSESSQFTSNASATFDQCTSCGNPGSALQTITTVASGTGEYAQGFVNNGFSYNPMTQGAISGINASVDKNITVSYTGTGFTNTFHPLIEQDGNYYIASIAGANFNITMPGGSSGYLTVSGSGLTAANFQQFDFTTGTFVAGTPNFSGDPMLFGLAQITTSATGSIQVDLDNLSLSIGVPEPSSLMLLAGVLSVLAVAVAGVRVGPASGTSVYRDLAAAAKRSTGLLGADPVVQG